MSALQVCCLRTHAWSARWRLTSSDPASYRDFETLIKRVGSHQGQGTEEERFKLWSLRL